MTTSPPPSPPPDPSPSRDSQPPGQPPAGYPLHYPPRPEGRSVSFYVAIFLGSLLLVSGGLNLLLLVFSAIGSAAGGFGGGAIEDDGGMYEMIVVGGDPDADVSVMRIPVQGAIMEGASPLLGAPGGMVSQVKRGLRVAAQTRNVRGVLLDINSPGGGVTDSDEIHRLILKFKEENDIEVLALFGDMAASGGYYIAAACDKIVARPTTITGSIGVIMSSYNYGDALRDLGIEPVVLKSPNTPFKDILSPTRTMEDEERQKLLAIIEEMYQRFVDIVDQGRPDLSRQEVQDLATGEIYSAMQAHRNGLVDAVGTVDDAHVLIQQMIDPELEKIRIVEYRRTPNLMDALFGMRQQKVSVDAAVARVLEAATSPRFLYYWQGGR